MQQPQGQLIDSVDQVHNDDPPLYSTLSNVSITDYESESGHESSQQDLVSTLGKDAHPPTRSLGISASPEDGRRKLLLVYIHGFMGSEDSFQKFPAHVHNFVANALAESHVVYSKFYPRYKSRRSMNIARDDFSKWIMPHESDQTDIILLGHSLGGILAAEVALSEAEDLSALNKYRHRILGTINFDVPLLGLHPSIVGTGISSLFQPKTMDELTLQKDASENTDPKSIDSLSSNEISQDSKESTASWYEQAPDSNFDPSFRNDIHRVKRSQFDGAVHFFKKNSGHLRSAIQEYANSYFEFGGCLADYSGLRRRYTLLKELEALDDMEPKADKQGRLQRRLRFINYYTASRRSPKNSPLDLENRESVDGTQSNQAVASEVPEDLKKLPSPALSEENPDLGDESLVEIDPTPMEEEEPPVVINLPSSDESYEELPEQLSKEDDNEENASILKLLPPLPVIPPEPPAFDQSLYKDKDILKQAQKEHARLVKLHERAQKEHDQTLKEREKLLQKLDKKQRKSASGSLKSEHKEALDEASTLDGEEDIIPNNTEQTSTNSLPTPQSEKVNHDTTASSTSPTPNTTSSSSLKVPKERVFCALPSMNNNSLDPLWVRVFMPDVDEVVAHQSIFIPNGLYYEWLVGDTATRIEKWVQDDCTRRVIWEQFGEFS